MKVSFKCDCRGCHAVKRSPRGSAWVTTMVRRGRRLTKQALKQGKEDLPTIVSFRYMDECRYEGLIYPAPKPFVNEMPS